MSTEQKLREALEELLYAHTDKAVAMARAALSLPATEKASAEQEPVGRVRIDSGEVHIVPFVRDAEISDLRAGQQVHAAPVSQPAPADHQPALRTIMRLADGFKEPCGQDPESPAAIRNGKFATIAQVAAQGLGLVNGPALDVPAPLPELSDEVFDVLSMARMVLFQYHKLYRLDSEQRLIDRIDAALAAKKGGA